MRALVILLSVLVLVMPGLAAAERRFALVIGNDAYDNVPTLLKAGNDARAMERTLSGMGFEVISAIDATRREMNRALQRLSNSVQPGDVAMLFYAGHAIEIEGENYLLPVDIPPAEPGQEGFVRDEAISLNRVLAGMRRTGARLNIAVLDACRDNPFAESTGRSIGAKRGLSRIVAPGGTFVMYSADAGQAALDRLDNADPDPNSVFTRTLLPLMQRPGLDLVELARETRRGVNKLAATVGHQQTPAYYDAILGEFRFSLGAPEPNPPTIEVPVTTQPKANDTAIEVAFWQSAEASGSSAAYQTYLDRFPNGSFADLARLKISELSVPKRPTEAELAARAVQEADRQRQQELERQRSLEAARLNAEREALAARNRALEERVARFKAEQRGPSFDCGKARRRDEIMICGSVDLAALDRLLSSAYKSARSKLSATGRDTLKLSQREWLKGRAKCRSERCLRTALVERIKFLEDF